MHKDLSMYAFRLFGNDIQVLELALGAGITSLFSSPSVLLYHSASVVVDTRLFGGFGAAWQRSQTGAPMFLTKITVEDSNKSALVGLSPSHPSTVVPVNLSALRPQEILCRKGAFFCGSTSLDISPLMVPQWRTGLFGGHGFYLQRISGNGMVFLKSRGTVVRKDLEKDEVLVARTGSLLAWERTVDFTVGRTKGWRNVLMGGTGLAQLQMSGPGTVFLRGTRFPKKERKMNTEVGIVHEVDLSRSRHDEDYVSRS